MKRNRQDALSHEGRWRPVICLSMVWLCFGVSFAQIKTHFFHTETFRTDEGLNHNLVYDFKADRNGMLWVQSVGHLQLFDGRTFIDMNHQMSGEPIYGKFSHGYEQDLYFLSGNSLSKLNTDQYTKPNSLRLTLPPITAEWKSYNFLYETRQQLFIWNTHDQLYQIDKATLDILNVITTPYIPHNRLIFYDIDPEIIDDTVVQYVDSTYRLISLDVRSGHFTVETQLPKAAALVQVSKDTIITIDREYIHIHVPGQQHSIPLPGEPRNFQGGGVLQVDKNRLLVALSNSIYEFHIRHQAWTAVYEKAGGEPLVEPRLRKLEQDIYGNIYFSTFNNGLVKIHPRNPGFDFIGKNDQYRYFVKCLSVSEQENLVLVGTLEEGLVLFDTLGQFKKRLLEFPDGSIHPYINGIVKLSESRFIIFTENAYLLQVHQDQYHISHIPGLDKSWPSYYNVNIPSGQNKVFYKSVYKGLLEIHDSIRVTFKLHPDSPLNGSIAVTPSGDSYWAVADGRLIELDPTLQTVRQEWTLPRIGFTRCLMAYNDNRLLLGGDVGLFMIQTGPDVKILNRLYDKVVYAILPGDTPEEFWFSTDYGLFKLKADLQLVHYSKESGLQENEFNTSSCFKTASGKLYFGGINGITSFYPFKVNESADHIITYVSSLSVNNNVIGRFFHTRPDSLYTFSHRENKLGIDLLGKGNKSPKSYNYQYFMKGLNQHWIDLGRENKINFHLIPGLYTFYYHIGDGFNPNAAPEHYLRIRILPPFYRRSWFILCGMLLLGGLVAYIIRLNKKRQTMKLNYEFQMKQKIQNERMRISRELHDNIGAQMGTVKRNLNFLITGGTSLSPDQVMKKMVDLETISTQINQELRDTIWVTQHEEISVFDFIARLKSYVFQTLGPESECRVFYLEHCDTKFLLGPFTALNVHRICQEAINNAVKHAGATEIKISFEGYGPAFKVRIKDNGKGFALDQVKDGYGLKHIRQRAAFIDAELNIESTPLEGTTIEVKLKPPESPDQLKDL